MSKIVEQMKSQVVLTISIIAAVITCFFVPINTGYIEYFDFRTLACLYVTLAVVGAFKNIHLFEMIAKQIVIKLHNIRNAILGIVFITYFASMILTNDMALLTFLPLGYFVLDSTGKKKYLAFTFIMQNFAANLGGMITPLGNPQNLYLFSYYNMKTSEFFEVMSLPFLTSTVLIFICCIFIKPEPLTLKEENEYKIDMKKTMIYTLLFFSTVLIVFRVIPYMVGVIVITLVLLWMDRTAIKEVNYPLLLTFCAFFVFSGNMAKIEAISHFFKTILPKSTLLIGALSSQVISNVPSAVLLSKFTEDYRNLLVSVNIGGCGTLIASLASVITYSEFKKNNKVDTKQYMLQFTIYNIVFLAILLLVQIFFGNS